VNYLKSKVALSRTIFEKIIPGASDEIVSPSGADQGLLSGMVDSQAFGDYELSSSSCT